MKNPIQIIAFTTFAVAVCAAGVSAQDSQTQATRPSGSPVGTSGTSAATADYRLVPGDKLRIQVFKDDKLTQDLQVRPDGKITLPLVGDIPAAGRTSLELRNAIAKGLSDTGTHENPVVTVIVVETVPPIIYVMGEVNHPGEQPLKGEMNVLQALAAAGGFKDFANTKKIRILRKGTSGVTTTLEFNYKDAIRGVGRPIVLQPGDTIIVP